MPDTLSTTGASARIPAGFEPWHARCFSKGSVRASKALCAGLFLGTVLLGRPAFAGNCGTPGQCGGVSPKVCISAATRTLQGGASDNDARPPEENPCGINYADCARDVTINFQLAIDASSAAAGDTLQVWAGPGAKSCINDAARSGSGQLCWKVADDQTPDTPSVNVRAMDIAAYLDATTFPANYSKANDVSKACEAQTSPGPISISIYFMLVTSDGHIDYGPTNCTPTSTSSCPAPVAEYEFQADTLGPFAPTAVSISVNDGYVTLSWTPSQDTSIAGYYVYCENFGKDASSAGEKEAGPTDSGGINVADGGLTGMACLPAGAGDIFNPVFTETASTSITTEASTPVTTNEAGAVVDGSTSTSTSTVSGLAGISQIPLGNGVRICASPTDDLDGAMTSGAATSSATISLVNYDYYVFAVAAVDTSGNVGPVGDLVCGIPGPLNDFWMHYVADGGLAGGGYCALQFVGTPGGSMLMAVGMGFVGVTFLRRRRRRR
jgi:hypothetical protein